MLQHTQLRTFLRDANCQSLVFDGGGIMFRQVEKDKIKLVIDSAVERGLTSKPPDAEKLVDFSFAKEFGS